MTTTNELLFGRTTDETNERETIDAQLESEVKIEDLANEIVEITIEYHGGHVNLTGRVKCHIGYCWVGSIDNGLTLDNGTILRRQDMIGGTNYSEGYKFHASV